MDHYQDIQIRPDPEFPAPMLMNALFAKLHRALVQLQSNNIGVSFPKVNYGAPHLGDRLRLHGSVDALQALQGINWLSGMRDHIETQEIASIPANTQHRRIKRVQVKSSAERLRRRYIKRHAGTSAIEAAELIPDAAEKRVILPFLQLNSESTGQRYYLFIEHQPLQATPVPGEFNAHGLSHQATVPWF